MLARPIRFSHRRGRVGPSRVRQHGDAEPGAVPPPSRIIRYSEAACGCSSMAEHQLPKLTARVRFPSPAQRRRSVSTESVDRASSHFYWGPSPQTPRYGDSRFVGGRCFSRAVARVGFWLPFASVASCRSGRVGSPFMSGTSCRSRRVAPHVWHELSLASGRVGLRVSRGLSLALVWVTPLRLLAVCGGLREPRRRSTARPGPGRPCNRNVAGLGDHLGRFLEAGCVLWLLPGPGRVCEPLPADRMGARSALGSLNAERNMARPRRGRLPYLSHEIWPWTFPSSPDESVRVSGGRETVGWYRWRSPAGTWSGPGFPLCGVGALAGAVLRVRPSRGSAKQGVSGRRGSLPRAPGSSGGGSSLREWPQRSRGSGGRHAR
jgi:hypothetical protein